MQRRRFLARTSQAFAALTSAPALAGISARTSASATPHLQDCRIASSQHYDCDTVLSRLHVGEPLRLARQPGNPHNPRAIEAFRHTHKLGYLPRMDNAAAASLLDRAQALRARTIDLDNPDAAWKPVRLRVWVQP